MDQWERDLAEKVALEVTLSSGLLEGVRYVRFEVRVGERRWGRECDFTDDRALASAVRAKSDRWVPFGPWDA